MLSAHESRPTAKSIKLKEASFAAIETQDGASGE
jgi:hypothetical protein